MSFLRRQTRQTADLCRAAQVCAAFGAPRSQRAEHAPVQLVQRYCPHLPRQAAGLRPRSVCSTRSVSIAASRARALITRATQLPPDRCLLATACGEPMQGGPSVSRVLRARSQQVKHAPALLVQRDCPLLPRQAAGPRRAKHAPVRQDRPCQPRQTTGPQLAAQVCCASCAT